ncbi:MAG: CrcB family protein [Eubacteriales bacterium]
MKKYLFVAVFACFGAIIRFLLESVQINAHLFDFPVNTLLINVAGSFVLCLILTIGFDVWKIDADLKQGLTTGFIGAFTTFSTFCKETVLLMQQNKLFVAGTYIAASLALGILAAFAGCLLGDRINHSFRKRIVMTDEREGDTQ